MEPSAGPALVDAAQRLKARGLVRHLMMSTHNRPSLQDHFRAFERGESPYDAFMLRYNAVHRGAEQDVFPHLPANRRPGILAYTATRWGHLCDPAKMPAGRDRPRPRATAIASRSRIPASTWCCAARRNGEQMQEALRALDAGPLAPDEMKRLHRIGDHIYGRYRPQFAEQGDRRPSRVSSRGQWRGSRSPWRATPTIRRYAAGGERASAQTRRDRRRRLRGLNAAKRLGALARASRSR